MGLNASKSASVYFSESTLLNGLRAMNIRKSHSRRNSRAGFWTNVPNPLLLPAPTEFLIADHRNVRFCFMQDSVGKKFGARQRRCVRFGRQFDRISMRGRAIGPQSSPPTRRLRSQRPEHFL